MSDSNLEQTPYLQTQSQSLPPPFQPPMASPFTNLQAHSLLCHPVLSYIPQCHGGCEGARLGIEQIRLESWLHHYVTVESDYPFELQYSGACTFLRELWGALHKHGALSQVALKAPSICTEVVTTSPTPKLVAWCSPLTSCEMLSITPGTILGYVIAITMKERMANILEYVQGRGE